MEITDYLAEETSFWKLLQKTKIEIPIIQRDYAQGRTGEEKVRKRFLHALYGALSDGGKLELDFIYGSEESGSLQPLDGQQRLTTLFLLHWYAACKENIPVEAAGILKNFTYETRASSRIFCEKLSAKRFDFTRLLPATDGLENRLSNTIVDASWFLLAWQKDPTISAMLNMLNDVHGFFKDIPALWHTLTVNQTIRFEYVELKNFGLSDDLYIKMNARGKALTAFEHFKAGLERQIERTSDQEFDSAGFARKLDTEWTDLVWDSIDKPDDIDLAFIKYFAGIAINRYAQERIIQVPPGEREKKRLSLQTQSKAKVTGEGVTRALVEERIQLLTSQPNELDPSDFNNPGDLAYLEQIFGLYADLHKAQEKLNIPKLELWEFKKPGNGFFDELIRVDSEFTYKQRTLFYAHTTFLVKCAEKSAAPDNWMRVIRNIVEHTTIDSSSTFIGAIGLVLELGEGCADIYGFLADHNLKSNFADNQVKEERWKASLIRKFNLPQSAFHAMEDTDFFQGHIMFGLYCMDQHEDHSSFQIDQLNALTRVFNSYMSGEDVSNDFRRALLTIDDNTFYNYWGTHSYGTNTMKRCLIEDTWDLYRFAYKNDVRHYLKDLVNRLVSEDLRHIIDSFQPKADTPNWKTRLIRENKLLDEYDESRYFGVTYDNQSCYLFRNKKRPASREECYKVK